MASVRRRDAVRLFSALAVAALITGPGCRQTSSEYVEAELRVQSRKVAELEHRLVQRDAEIETLRNTVTTFQASHVKPADAPESVYRDTALSRISLTLATGGKDADLDGKDDGIVVGVAPHDYDGDVFKCPGSCRVQLFETSATGTRRPIGDWSVSAEQLRGLWRTSLLGQGYHLTLAWQTPPTERRLRTVATFSTIDGRKFQAEKDFDVSTQPKGAPRMPGARLDSEPQASPASPPPAEPASAPVSDLPKPRGLGALSANAPLSPRPIASVLASSPKQVLGAPAPPSPQLPPSDGGGPRRARPEPAGTPPEPVQAAAWDQEHSPPPIIPPDRLYARPGQASPGDRADAEDVIVLPVSATRRAQEERPGPPPEKKVADAEGIPRAAPALAKPIDRIALPEEPPPPRAASKGPATIILPN